MALLNGKEIGKMAAQGTLTAMGQVTPWTAMDREFNLALWGTFAATVTLERSFDEGATGIPVSFDLYGTPSSYTQPVTGRMMEPELGMLYRFRVTAYTSGTINWRMSR